MPKIKPIHVSDLLQPTVPKSVMAATAFLDKLQASIVVTTRDLAMAVGVGPGTMRDYADHPKLSGYRHRTSAKTYWGSPRTIAEVKRLLTKRS